MNNEQYAKSKSCLAPEAIARMNESERLAT